MKIPNLTPRFTPRTSRSTLSLILLSFLSVFSSQFSIFAQGTAFTYQGRLNEITGPANGNYDFTFQVFDAATSGSSQTGIATNGGVSLNDGLFTVTLDFGASPFTAGAARWLEISVRTNGVGSFGMLSPRQALTATPYAVTAGKITGAPPPPRPSCRHSPSGAFYHTLPVFHRWP